MATDLLRLSKEQAWNKSCKSRILAVEMSYLSFFHCYVAAQNGDIDQVFDSCELVDIKAIKPREMLVII